MDGQIVRNKVTEGARFPLYRLKLDDTLKIQNLSGRAEEMIAKADRKKRTAKGIIGQREIIR